MQPLFFTKITLINVWTNSKKHNKIKKYNVYNNNKLIYINLSSQIIAISAEIPTLS